MSDSNNDWLTPQQVAAMLGTSVQAVYSLASRFEWETKSLGPGTRNGVRYSADDVHEELLYRERQASRWEA